MTKSNICVIIKKEKITKVKVGVQNLIVKEELEKVMAERLASNLVPIGFNDDGKQKLHPRF